METVRRPSLSVLPAADGVLAGGVAVHGELSIRNAGLGDGIGLENDQLRRLVVLLSADAVRGLEVHGASMLPASTASAKRSVRLWVFQRFSVPSLYQPSMALVQSLVPSVPSSAQPSPVLAMFRVPVLAISSPDAAAWLL